ncbi:MAG: ATP synthase F1 subunit epsilon [Chitinophagales bacterium]|jgi:F-type H+-transporting ATPase subunit epsilon|nr:ATP synthase F1 subunit epsilon [Chitinophagales bacterium]
MQLDILTPEKKIFSGKAQSVSLPGVQGRFQVLENHAPIISALQKGELKVMSDSQESKWNISGGLVEVLKNKVTVLVEAVV